MDSRIKINSEGDKIPAPPPPEVEIRTMKSDLKAFKEGGGEMPGAGVKTVFTPTSFAEAKRTAVESVISETPGYSGSEKPIFVSQENVGGDQKKNLFKFVAIVIGVLTGIIILALIGYYVVFPVIFK